jgi:signal transduction histidine kinase
MLHNLTKYEVNLPIPLELVETDIYEFKLLNHTLDKMSKKIRLDFLNLKEFNENAAHELQTPLAIIKSKLELLIQRENLDEKQLQLISAVFEATTRMSKLNQGLLLISKIENNQFIQTEPISVPQILDKTIEHFGEMIEHRHITVTKKYHHPAKLKANPVLAEIFITNLVSNAIRHNILNGYIVITVNHDSFTISNTGQILKTDPQNLFERFRKSENNPDSVGLGLSIVQKIADLNQMKVEYLHQEGVHTLRISFG